MKFIKITLIMSALCSYVFGSVDQSLDPNEENIIPMLRARPIDLEKRVESFEKFRAEFKRQKWEDRKVKFVERFVQQNLCISATYFLNIFMREHHYHNMFVGELRFKELLSDFNDLSAVLSNQFSHQQANRSNEEGFLATTLTAVEISDALTAGWDRFKQDYKNWRMFAKRNAYAGGSNPAEIESCFTNATLPAVNQKQPINLAAPVEGLLTHGYYKTFDPTQLRLLEETLENISQNSAMAGGPVMLKSFLNKEKIARKGVRLFRLFAYFNDLKTGEYEQNLQGFMRYETVTPLTAMEGYSGPQTALFGSLPEIFQAYGSEIKFQADFDHRMFYPQAGLLYKSQFINFSGPVENWRLNSPNRDPLRENIAEFRDGGIYINGVKMAGTGDKIWVLGPDRKFAISTNEHHIMHHSHFFQDEEYVGLPIACAGHLTINSAGKISKISNGSGHYCPMGEQLLLAVKYLSQFDIFSENCEVSGCGLMMALPIRKAIEQAEAIEVITE